MQQIELTQDHVVKIMKVYDDCEKELKAEVDRDEFNFLVGKTGGIVFVLNTLGIYIDGINWDGGANDAQNNEASGS